MPPRQAPEPYAITATQGHDAVTAGSLSVAAIVDSQLDRIAGHDDAVKAWAHVDPDKARAAAAVIDATAGALPLRGVTVGIKDVIDTADLPTAYNSPIYHGHQPAADAACVARLRAAGAVILGKTETTEFAHAHPAPTVNPHNPAHTPGGSSSGSAAALAGRMVMTALGTQTGGSTIRPAAFCGVHAIKPTFGLIDTTGVKPLSRSLDTVGIFGREVADLTLLMPVLATLPANQFNSEFRIAVCRTEAWDSAEPYMQATVEAAAETLTATGITARAIDHPMPLADLDRIHQTIMAFETAAAFTLEWTRSRSQLSDSFAAFIAKGQAITQAAYDDAIGQAAAARDAFDASLGDDEIVLTPSVTGEAPRGFASTGNPVFNRPWTLLHVPCVHVPWRHGPAGLPIGFQLVGKRGSDMAVLSAAMQWQARAGRKETSQ